MTRLRAALPFAAFYAAVFLALGIFLPFWPVYLDHRGLSPAAIGTLMALGTWAKSAANPVAGHLADRLGRRRGVIAGLAALAAIGAVAVQSATGFWPILVCHLLLFASFQAVIPLGESQTMAAVAAGGLDYGRLRLWGSLAFIAGVLGIGESLAGHGPDLIPVAVLLAFVAIVLAAPVLPPAERPADRSRRAPVTALLRDRQYLAFLAAGACLQASHAAYYAFSAVHWKAAGIAPPVVAWLWTEGVVAEILLFAVGGAAVARLGPRGLLLAAGVGGLARWTTLAATTSVPALAAVQWLHGLTFGAAHLGAMYFLTRHAPAGLQTTAQGVYAAVSGGLAMGLMTLTAGWVYDLAGGTAFLLAAGTSGAALAITLAAVRNPHPV
ncbi:MFS transporter, PPP family, 3-phenylpropionic acid transporter [Limimonas halophila]|uniref:MFS transporter, PPP family, 3-phenylpropionic acid transporter n=1 Tax=Limimonas halophila TaxID=1082479 RepID=A0A1G7N564_9PROT|nr:MFS transporter [Limimonas halophila]SDF69076.1 MFS transporter, PPP family, 3-phenylpropionic acid transporter [Limimonas halophila]